MITKKQIIAEYQDLINARYPDPEQASFFIEDRYQQAKRCTENKEIPMYFIGKDNSNFQVTPNPTIIKNAIMKLYRVALRSLCGRINFSDSYVYTSALSFKEATSNWAIMTAFDFIDNDEQKKFLNGEKISHTLYIYKRNDGKFVTTNVAPVIDKFMISPEQKKTATITNYGDPTKFYTREFLQKMIPYTAENSIDPINFAYMNLCYYPKVRTEDPMYTECNITTVSDIESI